VRLSWTEDTMTVAAKGEKGDSQAELRVQATGAGRVGINTSYLLDYLKGKDGVVTMGVTDEQGPILFRYGTSPIVVVMPMMVEWEPKPAVVAEAEAVAEQAEAEAISEEEAEEVAIPDEAVTEAEIPAEDPEVIPEDKPKRKRKRQPKG